MFSIENYITGLIISKVEKFVKNINPNEFKVSLWEGNVVFQNLELKLDVLDEELQLPFTFISGHLQFMKLEIPWTKIATEPITATINDLELVLKLNDVANLQQTRKPKKKKTSIEEDSNAGYLASLITKIINNISIICNNVSIKFLEDDIVFSMNIQHLSIYSADSKWKRAFIDVASSTSVIFRKLINIIDLTMCLDKRNSLGKIEYVQEPFLYKCSIELRVFRRYNPASPEKHSVTRIDLQTKTLNINISSQQFPMLVRLINLVLALKSGRLQESYGIKPAQGAAAESSDDNEESWMSWMWNNIVPTIIADDQHSDDPDINSKKIFEFGTYIENAYLSLKSQDLLHDPIIPSAKTAILKPLIEFYFRETYATTVICGRRHFNVKGGVDFFEIKALDNCPCGTPTSEECIMRAGNSEPSGKYLIDSYFDRNTTNRSRYEEMFSNYFERNGEETLLAKVSAMAFDIYHTIEIPDDRGSSDLGSDLEYSNLSENYVIRVFGDGITMNVSSDAIHRVEKLVQYYRDCEFVSYVKEEKIPVKSQLSPATADDYEALINEIPMRSVIVKLKNTMLHVREWSHERSLRTTRKYARQSSLNDISGKPNVDLEVKIGDFSVAVEVPLYKNRLIFTACQLPDNTSNQLFKKCFNVVRTNVKNVMVDMRHESHAKKVCEILKISSTNRSLIFPHLWEEFDIQETYFDIEFNGLSFMMNPAQFVVFYRVINSIVQENPTGEIERDLLQNLNNSQLVVLQLTSRILKARVFKLQQAHIAEFTISDLIGLSWKTGMKSTVLNMPDTTFIPAFFSSKMKNFKSESMLNVSIQIPINSATSTAEQLLLTTIAVEMSGGCINMDPLLREFLSFKLFQAPPKKAKELNRTLSTSTKPLLTEFSNVQQSSAHSSSEYPETICPSVEVPKVNKDLLYYFKMCRSYVVHVNSKPMEFYYSTAILESLKASDSIRDIVQSSGSNTIVLKTPNIAFHSVKNKLLSKLISPHFPSSLPGMLWGNENCLTWNLELSNMNVFIIGSERKKFDIVQNASVKVSIADESQFDEKEMYTGNILIEIFPLYLNFHTSQIDLLSVAVNDLSNFSILNPTARSKQDIVESSEQDNPPNLDLKDFLGLPTGSTITKTSLPDGGMKKPKSNINFYIQWICSKVSLSSFVDTLPVHKKFVLEIDEILFTLHQQEFFQLKCKITSISGNFFHLINDIWAKNLNLGFNVQADENITDTVSRFLDMTVTKAETVNVHSKWNLELKRSTQLILNDVSEINVILQSFDVIASDEFIHFLPIFKLFQRPNDKNQKAFMQYSGSELPLVHLKCNGFRVFLPNLHKTSNFNVLILKVNGLQVTPNAVNNLIRTQILRPDIHSKASHLGVLDLVGSKIEDRQYQLLVRGCSLTSSSWNDITAIITEKNVENYDNPATIWNNFENGPSSPNFKFYTIFKDSSFSFIYAPCIKFKEVLVAGAAIEINCIENMNIVTSLEQMILFIDIGNQMKSIADTFTTSDEKKPMDSAGGDERPRKFHDKKSFDDSGVASTMSHSNHIKTKKLLYGKKHSTSANENGQLVPYEFTFTSSKFNLNFTIEDKSYGVLLDTPNLYVTQSRTDKSLNISLYDLKIDFETQNIFSTRHGNIDAISGITPSLLRVKITEKSYKNTDLRIEVKRSIFLQITESGIVECLRVLNILKHHSVAYENVREDAPLAINSKARKFDTIKLLMSNFKTINASTDQIVTEFKSDKSHFKAGLHHFKGKLKLFERPEKIETNIDVEHMTMQCDDKLFLHPLTLEAKAKITQEYWKKEPLIYLNVSANYIKVDVWPRVIRQFHDFGESLKSLVVRSDENHFTHLNDSEAEAPKSEEKIPLTAAPPKGKNGEETIEHFLDDLRSGIYTFVDVETPFQELPLPYQIHYQDNNIICWRYPLPRALHKIKIFPVPFQTQNELKIQCKIEYYSQLKSQFEELMALSMNENETKVLDLKPNLPFSEIWRVKFQVNLKRDSDDDEEEEEAEISNYLQMHPKVLLACLRIDSYYKPMAIPTVNSLLKVSKIQVSLMNENEERHETVKCNIDALQIVTQHYDEHCENINVEGAVSVDIKDFGCDNLIPFIKNFHVRASLDINHEDVNLNLLSNMIRLKYSSAIGHSLITTAQLWKQIFENTLGEVTGESAKYTIFNNTASTVCINQLGTNEMIYVMPKSSKRYQFYTDKLVQTLQLSVGLANDEWSEKTEALCVNHEGVQYVKVSEHQYCVVSVKNISNYQRKITIDGQVVIYNVTKENFTVQYKRYDKDIENADKCEVQFLDLDHHGNGSLFGACEFDSQQTIRLHLKRSERKAFSGEIPLREIVVNNKPWLVKVPLGSNGNFICFWVRIIRQNISEDICRVLVLICPVFIAKSLFPSSIVLSEEATKDHYEIAGGGEVTEIDMKGTTHENEHKLIFPSQHVQQNNTPATVTLSYKLINKNSFFKIPDEYSDIAKAIEKIEEKRVSHWPCSRDEEFPEELGKYFKNLEVVRITGCDMKILLKHQMKGLSGIKYLDLLGNRIEKLESDTFENTPNLIEIMLNNNRLQFIGFELLRPLTFLKSINLGGNYCIITHARSQEEFLRFNEEIKLKCSDISKHDLLAKMNVLQQKLESVVRLIEGLSLKNSPKKN